MNTIDFIEYLKNLAADGETMLIVHQKPTKDLYGDGTTKYVWLPSFPERYKPQAAWYGNTGLYLLDRFENGKLSASAANCEHVAVMVLDDIGTKSKEPSLPPTWVMETSPDNFQWGYTFKADTVPTKNEFAAAIKAIANAGYTDGGAINPVRNFRIPGSQNLKPGKNNFESRIVAFHPEREYSLSEICTALNVTPGAADTTTVSSIRIEDDGGDDVLEWLSEHNAVLDKSNGAGWYGVLCPNAAQHSGGSSMARYHPVSRSFTCFHEHCAHVDSHVFLDWVANQGGPRQQTGLRSELLSANFAKAMKKLPEAPRNEVLDVMEAKDLGRIAKERWHERFAYVMASDSYFDLHTRQELSRASFNALYRHVPCNSIHNGRRVEASVSFDERREQRNAVALTNVIYAPGESLFVGRGTDVYGNRWVNARPSVDGEIGDISRWLNLLDRLVPVEDEREHILNVMAYKLQHPEVKINHAVLHVGNEGCGKDTLWAPFIWAVCGPSLINRGYTDADTIHSQWGYALESEVLILNELKEPEAASRRALANKLKPIIAAPPEMLDINRKGLHPYQMVNRVFVLAFSNEQIPISLAQQDRRWFCIQSASPRMTPEEGMAIWNWYKAGGYAQIAAFLYARDVSKFNPAAVPGMTEFKLGLIDLGRSGVESFIMDQMNLRIGEFSKGVVGAPFHSLCDRISGSMPNGAKVPPSALMHALAEGGWIDMGRLASQDYPSSKRIFAAPDILGTHTKSEIRRMVEPDSKVVNLNAWVNAKEKAIGE
jgi:hypothetical protein